MSIHLLPQHLINKLKAGEIVERPAAVVKELLENSLDAGATKIGVWIEDGGKQLIKITDNGSWIVSSELPLAVARYATSKITSEQDLEQIHSYGFRGEALAAIGEVSILRLQTRACDEELTAGIGFELSRIGDERTTKQIPFSEEHGTTVIIQELFGNVPARKKFLKSTTTERYHIRNLLLNYLLVHRDKDRQIRHQGKSIRSVSAVGSFLERVQTLTNQERSKHLRPFETGSDELQLRGILWDAALHFSAPEQLRFFVNRRPVDDKIIKKALLQVTRRQLPAGMYPFAYLFVDIDPKLLDVNVHPRKSEVKFLDPGGMFTLVTKTIEAQLGDQKVSYAAFTKWPVQYGKGYNSFTSRSWSSFPIDLIKQQHGYQSASSGNLFPDDAIPTDLLLEGEPVQIVGQLRQTYILASSMTGFYLIDQHALAERVTFERLKKAAAEDWFTSHILLQPIVVQVPTETDVDAWSELLAPLGIDCSPFGSGKMIVHAVPEVFVTYTLDIQLLFNHLLNQQEKLFGDLQEVAARPQELLGLILEEIFGMKACKASIKAGQQLSMPEMQQLLRGAAQEIPGMFVCQHGRPCVMRIPREEIETLVGRR